MPIYAATACGWLKCLAITFLLFTFTDAVDIRNTFTVGKPTQLTQSSEVMQDNQSILWICLAFFFLLLPVQFSHTSSRSNVFFFFGCIQNVSQYEFFLFIFFFIFINI